MATNSEHQDAIKTAAKIAEAYAGASVPGKTDPEVILEKVYKTIIKLTDEYEQRR